MKITLADVETILGKTGSGLRCTLTLSATHPEFGVVQQSTRGCLVFRNSKGAVSFLTPCVYVGAAKVRHRPIVLSPALAKWLEAEIERRYGRDITRNPKRGGSALGAKAHPAGDMELEVAS